MPVCFSRSDLLSFPGPKAKRLSPETLTYTITRPMQTSHQGEGAQRRPLEAAQRLRERAVQEQLQALEHRLTQQQQQHLQVNSLLFL